MRDSETLPSGIPTTRWSLLQTHHERLFAPRRDRKCRTAEATSPLARWSSSRFPATAASTVRMMALKPCASTRWMSAFDAARSRFIYSYSPVSKEVRRYERVVMCTWKMRFWSGALTDITSSREQLALFEI